MISQANFWLLQVNSKKWDIKAFLSEGNKIEYWSVVNNKRNIMPMDKFILWKTGSDGGVIGWGRFTGEKIPANSVDEKFWHSEVSINAEFFAVEMQFVSLDVSFPRKYMKNLPSFGRSILFRSPQSANAIRLSQSEWEDFSEVLENHLEKESENHEDQIILEITSDLQIPETTRLDLVESRVGQGQFRKMVLRKEPICRVTGTSIPDFLIASHIKPWRNCSNEERLDANNGLMLAPHIDRLFDKGWISFSDHGDLLISRSLSEEILRLWSLTAEQNVGEFNSSQANFLAYHRSNIFLT
jgi:hypothetical protein